MAGRRLRSGLLVAAVALAAALSVATAGLVGTIGASVRLAMSRMAGLADLEIRHTYGARIDAALLMQARAWPEVAAASGRLDVGVALETITADRRVNHLALGVDPDAYARLYPPEMVEGRWLRGPGEIVIDQRVARSGGLKVGDAVELRTARSTDMVAGMADAMLGTKPQADESIGAAEPRVVAVVGVIRRPALEVLQRPTGIIDLDDARGLAGLPGKIDAVLLQLRPGVKAQDVATGRAGGMPPGVAIHTLAASTSGVDKGLGAVRIMLLLVTAIVLLSAGFIIVTGLTTAVTERARELGILRCVGASRGQIAGAQLMAGAALAGLGALLGTPLGLFLAYLVFRRHREVLKAGFAPDWFNVAAALGLAVLTGVVAAAYPAYRASSVQPLEALASRARRPSARGVLACLGIGLGCVAVAPLVVALPLHPQTSFWSHVILGLPLHFVGFFLLSVPALAALAWTLSGAISILLRLPPTLLRQSVLATPFRHGFTGAAMMLGLAMLVGIWTNGRSALGDWFSRIEMPDAFVHSFVALTDSQTRAIAAVPGVARSCPTTLFPVQAIGKGFGVAGFAPTRTLMVSLDPQAFLSMIQIQWVEGDPATAAARLSQGRALLVSREYKVAHKLGVGSTITLDTPAQGPVEFEIVGVVASPGLEIAVQFFGIHRYYADAAVASVFASRADAGRYFGNDSANLVLLQFEKGVNEARVMTALRKQVPGVIVGSSSMIRLLVRAVAKGLMGVASSLALATLLIACLGVGNLVLANIASRQFEYGVLRATGASRGLLGRLIAAEVVLIALSGCIVGTGMGLSLAAIDRVFQSRLLGVTYSATLPWDVIALGWGIVVGLALLAAAPAIVRLMLTPPRTLLAAE